MREFFAILRLSAALSRIRSRIVEISTSLEFIAAHRRNCGLSKKTLIYDLTNSRSAPLHLLSRGIMVICTQLFVDAVCALRLVLRQAPLSTGTSNISRGRRVPGVAPQLPIC